EDIDAVARRGNADRFDFLNPLDRQTWKSFELWRTLEAKVHLPALDLELLTRTRILKLIKGRFHRAIVFAANRSFPLAVITTRIRPAARFFAGVIEFAHEKIGFLNRTFTGHFPGRIGHHRFTPSITVFNLE